MSNDDDPFDTTLDGGMEVEVDLDRELDAVLDDLESLLKNGEVIAALTARGINASLALVAAGGLRAYVKGKKADAADDFATASEEIRSRLAAVADIERGSGGRRA